MVLKVAVLGLLTATILSLSPLSCTQFSQTECVRCLNSYHPYNGQCFYSQPGCLQYSNGANCFKCNPKISTLVDSTCVLNPGATVSQVSLDANCSQLLYQPLAIEKVSTDAYFLQINQLVMNGQFATYISQSKNSVQFFSTYSVGGINSYRIVYTASSGGLLVCVVDFNLLDGSIILRRATAISPSQLVSNCVDYSKNAECLLCQTGYHLQNGKCYQDIWLCISYLGNICLKCVGYAVLIENKCTTLCTTLSDSRIIKFRRVLPTAATILANSH